MIINSQCYYKKTIMLVIFEVDREKERKRDCVCESAIVFMIVKVYGA